MNLFLSMAAGFFSGGSLIIAIGAQNAFVIRQGIRRQHLLLTALVCSLLDALLISFGVLGMGSIISNFPSFLEWARFFAMVFLFAYGALTIKSIFQKHSLQWSKEGNMRSSMTKTLLSLLALSLLNPHVYLDTVVLLGSIAAQQPKEEQFYFGLGAMCSSFIWFFSLTYGARLLAPLFQKEKSWKVIDGMTALTMWGIAFTL